MRIVKLEDLHADAGWRVHSFLKLITDEGLVGWSEYNEQFGAGGVTDLIRRFANAVIGMDPREVGLISAALHAASLLAAGGINHQAVAAIENACLDVKAKALGVPVCALFGGPYRKRLPLYWSHCGSFRVWQRELFEGRLGKPPIRTLDDLKDLGREAAGRGFTALKANPLPIGSDTRPFNPGFHIASNFLSRAPDDRLLAGLHDVVSAFRAGAGPRVGVMLDLNFGQRPEGILRIARALEECGLTWLEFDLHDSDALAFIRRSARVPIASLETLHGQRAYRPYFQTGAVDVAIIDVLWNGLLESVRIANLADAYEVDVAPHNFYGDLASLMSAQFCAAIPNFRIMEYEVDDVPWKSALVSHPPVIENGELVVSLRPGWGADINEDAVRAHPPKGRARDRA
jgi:galactonate dehydratase